MKRHAKETWLDPVRRLKRILVQQFKRPFVFTRPARSDEPFATHVPVLVAISHSLGARRVLELGCGPYSTGLFLDRRCFPQLETLVSIENDGEWYRTISAKFAEDGRLRLVLVDGAVAAQIQTLDVSGFDLIFIDDSKTGAERVGSIEAVLTRISRETAVVIHDFEFAGYREAVARRMPVTHVLVDIDGITPGCGLIVSMRSPLHAAAMRIQRQLRREGTRTAPSDIDSWLRVVAR